MRKLNCGGMVHLLDQQSMLMSIRSIDPNVDSLVSQSSEIHFFASDVGLKLNNSKFEVIQLSQTSILPLEINLDDVNWTTKKSARCLGIQWQSNLSAKDSVSTNITKARKALFGLGSTKAFHGDLNPLSSSNIFETCVLPGFLYGCETWLLDSSCNQALESFNVR